MSVARIFAHLLRAAADKLEPPAELVARGQVERAASRARHPSVSDEYVLPTMPGHIAPVVPLPQRGDDDQ